MTATTAKRGLLVARRDFTPLWKRGLIASAVLVTIFVISLLTRGLNLGIDFEGGGVWEVPAGDASVSDVRDALRPIGLDNAQIQEATDQDGNGRIQVRTDAAALERTEEVRQVLADVTGSTANDVDTNTVGPSWGDEITKSARTALIWFFFAIAAYMALRLEWRMAVGGLIAVFHDIILTVGVYSVTGFEVTPATVIAFLTILGYSLYDTVVVFDRIRENEARNAGGKASYRSLVNVSMGQVLTRSINTTITSVIPVLSILVVGSFLLGATTLREFGVALLVGLIAGTYSSLFVATPVLLALKEREPSWAKLKEREARLGPQDEVLADDGPPRRRVTRKTVDAEAGDDAADGDKSRPKGAVPERPSAAASGTLGHPPRPRKQKNRKKR